MRCASPCPAANCLPTGAALRAAPVSSLLKAARLQPGLMMLEAGQELNNMNVGAIEACEIGDTVWLDGNGNGLQDYGEANLAGVDLTLLHADTMIEAARTTSDEYGYYHFRNLRPAAMCCAWRWTRATR